MISNRIPARKVTSRPNIWHVVKQMAAKHAEWVKTLAPLARVPEIGFETPLVPTGHGWAYASANSKTK